jgi:hypothetical protein
MSTATQGVVPTFDKPQGHEKLKETPSLGDTTNSETQGFRPLGFARGPGLIIIAQFEPRLRSVQITFSISSG